MSTRCQLKQLTPVVTSQKPLNLMMGKLAPILVALPRGQKLEVVVKGGKAATPAPVPAPAPAKKAPALAPSSSEAPTSVLGVPAPAPSPGPSVSNYFRMKPLVYSVASEA
ncbi:unnamed protein product [Sphagnum jensenii]|uniref:Uncharacterized protein n=1 Tax=Sphagnum jensenii TaxID=128206 RepID=A0ABP0X5F5_9BRYO